ncbi:MAG: glycosyltransferase [Chromatiales bacterium]|jgi:glycosyltransferase involved in cell wall biosynthesis|nr:glycosyltransferase [Chromatiales bacterium]
MRVLCVTSHRGAITNVRPEAEVFVRLQQQGVAMTVLTQRDSIYVDRMLAAGVEVVDFEPRWRIDPRAIAGLRRRLRAGGHDILHLFNNKAITTGLIAALGLPVKVVTYRGQTGNIKRHDPSAYLTHLNPRVDCVVCVAEAVRADLIANGLPARKAVTIYKGHDPAWYDLVPADLSALGLAAGALRVGLVANARPRKGVPVFLEALRQLPADVPCEALLVGAGMDAFAPLAAGMPSHVRVHLLGYRTDAAEVIAACDVSVLPALRREGLPKTTIEAMACGVAPVVTRTGGNAELVEDGVSGLVVPPGDAAALAAALARLAREPGLRRQFAAAARARIASHFHIDQTVARTRALYESLLASGR